MAFDLSQALQRISEKSRFLTQRYNVVVQERDQARQRVDELTRAVQERDRELQALRMRVEFLTVVSTMAPDREAIEKTRALITKLMRDIDRCIADLND